MGHKASSSAVKQEKPLQDMPDTGRETIVDEPDQESYKRKIYKDAKDAFLEGNRLFRESQFDLAKMEYTNALNTLRAKGAPDESIPKAAALSNIAILEFADGRYDEAKKLLEEALAIRRSWFVSKRPDEIAPGYASMEMVSVALSKDNKFCRTPNEQKILGSELKEHGALDSVIADTMNNLAACLEVLGELLSKLYRHLIRATCSSAEPS